MRSHLSSLLDPRKRHESQISLLDKHVIAVRVAVPSSAPYPIDVDPTVSLPVTTGSNGNLASEGWKTYTAGYSNEFTYLTSNNYSYTYGPKSCPVTCDGNYGEYYLRSAPGAFIYEEYLTGVFNIAYSNQTAEFSGLSGPGNGALNTFVPGGYRNYGQNAVTNAVAFRYDYAAESNRQIDYCAGTGTAGTYAGSCPVTGTAGVAANDAASAAGMYIASPTGASQPIVAADAATVYESDNIIPQVTVASYGSYTPSTWTNSFTSTVSLNGTSVDSSNEPGLGYSATAIGTSANAFTAPLATSTSCGTAPCPGTASTALTYSSSQLPEGRDTVCATGESFAGNYSSQNPSYNPCWTVEIDRTPPPAPAVTGLSANGWVGTTPPTLTITPTDPPAAGANASSGPSTVSISVDGGTPTVVPCTSQCSWQVPSGLAEGLHSLSVTTTDAAGNVGQATTIPFNVDLTPPVVNASGPIIDAGLSSGTVGGGDVQFGYDAADMQGDPDGPTVTTSGVVSVELLIDGQDANPNQYLVTQSCPNGGCTADGNFYVNTAALTAGSHTFELLVTDQAGNVGTSTTTVTVAPNQAVSDPEETPTPASSTPTTSLTAAQLLASTAANVASPTLQEASTIDSVDGESLQPALGTVPETSGTSYDAINTGLPVDFGDDLGNGFEFLSSWGAVDVVPQGVAANDAAAVSNGTVLNFADSLTDVDTFERPSAVGAEVVQQMTSPLASSSFSWAISADDGQTFQQLPDGQIAVLANVPTSVPDDPTSSQTPDDGYEGAPSVTLGPDPITPYSETGSATTNAQGATEHSEINNTADTLGVDEAEVAYAQSQIPAGAILLAVIPDPWAVDATGAEVPTTLSVSGNVVTMTVDTSATSIYPVTAGLDFASGAATEFLPTTVSSNGVQGGIAPAITEADSTCNFQTSPCPGPPPDWSNGVAWAYAHHAGEGDGIFYSYAGAGGGDCTNYASLILLNAGVPFKDDQEKGPGTWWTNLLDAWDTQIFSASIDSPGHSLNFTVAADFWHWAISNGYAELITAPHDWAVGDMQGIIYHPNIGSEVNNVVNHLQVVTGLGHNISGNYYFPYFTQHSGTYKWDQYDEQHVHSDLMSDHPSEGASQLLHIRFIRH